jgi:hypothetical protein
MFILPIAIQQTSAFQKIVDADEYVKCQIGCELLYFYELHYSLPGRI